MKAVFAGSFDPITNGHLEVIRRAAKLFDRVYVAVLHNPSKNYLFPSEMRLKLVSENTVALPNVTAVHWEGALADFCETYQVDVIVKGLRNERDWQYEKDMAAYHRELKGLETLFLNADGKFAHLSSSGVKELWQYGLDFSAYVPQNVAEALKTLSKNQK